MRILWLTDDRQHCLMDYYEPLRQALRRIAHVTTIYRPIGCEAGRYCYQVTQKGLVPPRIVDPDSANAHDWIVCDALWSYLDEDWGAIRRPRAAFWADCHGPMVDVYLRRAVEQRWDLFLPLYRRGWQTMNPYVPAERVRWLPYWVDPDTFRPWGLGKSCGLLLSGAVHPTIYPWRQAVQDQCAGHEWFRQLPRPPDTTPAPGWPVGDAYSIVLNQAWMAFGCTSRFGYPLTKLFEIPASGTALVTDGCPDLWEIGFEAGRNCVALASMDRIPEQIEAWLAPARRPELVSLIEAGRALVHTRHSTTVRAGQLLRLLEGHPTALPEGY